jgi:6-phosphogluconolactonase/glucosamine-6-phosphate isomerase/deaminase
MSKIFEPATDFKFQPADYVPFKDRELCEKLRKISGTDLEKHANPDFNIKVMMNPHPVLIATLFARIKEASEKGKKITLILGNPEPDTYIPLAQLINYFKVDCRNVHLFAMDEWADQDGNIAPETYQAGFAHSMLKYLVFQIDEKLRMPLENVHYPTTKNINSYSDMITDCGEGGADICSSSPGWTGHMAFIDPVPDFFPEGFDATGATPPTKAQIDEWLNMKARIVDLHPLTVAQNSLHGVFGQSGYIADVPPKAATIGPIDVKNARERIEVHALLTNGTFSSWQRMTSRLVLHGPVTPLIPSSMLQLMKTQVLVSDELAAPFECWEKVGY